MKELSKMFVACFQRTYLSALWFTHSTTLSTRWRSFVWLHQSYRRYQNINKPNTWLPSVMWPRHIYVQLRGEGNGISVSVFRGVKLRGEVSVSMLFILLSNTKIQQVKAGGSALTDVYAAPMTISCWVSLALFVLKRQEVKMSETGLPVQRVLMQNRFYWTAPHLIRLQTVRSSYGLERGLERNVARPYGHMLRGK